MASPLDPSFLRAQRDRLQAMARQLDADLRAGRAKLEEDVADEHVVGDRKDDADHVIQAGVDSAELERDLVERAAVAAALQRLDSGHYGLCIDCAEAIAVPRLAAQPWALRCLACQSRAEHRSPRGA